MYPQFVQKTPKGGVGGGRGRGKGKATLATDACTNKAQHADLRDLSYLKRAVEVENIEKAKLEI